MWRRTLQPQALNLVRVLPLDNATWLSARLAAIPALSPSTRYWAELRDDVLILYPASHLLAEYLRRPTLAASATSVTSTAAAAMPTAAAAAVVAQEALPAHAMVALEALPAHAVVALAEHVPSAHAHAFVLPALRVLPHRRHPTAIVLRGRPRAVSCARLCFDSPPARAEWRRDIHAAVHRDRKRLSDFRVLHHVGKGASGRVYHVEDNVTAHSYALKVIEKTTVFESKDTYRHAMDERLVLQMIRHHPYILDMHYAFQNAKRLFLVTEFCPAGDLFEYMNRRVAPLDENVARFVSAQVLLALAHLHQLGIVYRDLKLENILIDAHGHIRLADFGLTKVLRQPDGSLKRTNTFCGTREYVAPEMLRGESYDMSLDFWTFGILLYEMLSGRTPFYASDHSEIYKRIEKSPITYPRNLSSDVRNLISKLLVRDPHRRIGGREGIAAIRKHAWYKSVDWDAMYDRDALESPLQKSVLFLKRESEKRTSQISDSTTTNTVHRKKSRKEQKQEKAMANVLADVDADLRYASSHVDGRHGRHGQQQEQHAPSASAAPAASSLTSKCGSFSGSLLGRPRSRAEAAGDIVLAGYSFYDQRRRAMSEDAGAVSESSRSTAFSHHRWMSDENGGELDGNDTRHTVGGRSRALSSMQGSYLGRRDGYGESVADAIAKDEDFTRSQSAAAGLGNVDEDEALKRSKSESPTCVRTRANTVIDVMEGPPGL